MAQAHSQPKSKRPAPWQTRPLTASSPHPHTRSGPDRAEAPQKRPNPSGDAPPIDFRAVKMPTSFRASIARSIPRGHETGQNQMH